MSDGTTINGVYARRIHKHNAREIEQECEDDLQAIRDRVLVLAAMSPMSVDEGDGPVPWPDYIERELNAVWPDIRENSLRSFLAAEIRERPDECEDELEEPPA